MRNKSDYREEDYKTDIEILMKNPKLQFECESIENGRPTLDSTTVDAKTSYAKTSSME